MKQTNLCNLVTMFLLMVQPLSYLDISCFPQKTRLNSNGKMTRNLTCPDPEAFT